VRSAVRVCPGQPILVRLENGALAQLGERLLCKQDVVGSIPSGSTILLMDPMITTAVIEITELQNTLLRRKSKETKFADTSCEGKVGGSFDIVKRCSTVPFDPHPGEEHWKHVNSG
jgi:hypothetical protein